MSQKGEPVPPQPPSPVDKDKKEAYGPSITNDAVEAAVMRYVGGDYNHWTNDFLSDDMVVMGKKKKREDAEEPKKKKMKVEQSSKALVDPELAQLDLSSNEHEQLVQAAINDAKALARLSEFEQNYILLQQSKTKAEMGTSEVATLVAQAATLASEYVHGRPQGKMFSKEEHDAIDKFIYAYCQIHKMTRQDICKRIWLNNRTKDSFWDLLQKVLPHRLRALVYKHVRRAYHIFAVRGKWTPEEDAQLGELARSKEGQWKAIGEMMGRMPEDCRDRWRNYVKCGNKRAQNKWTEEEEDKLKSIIQDIFQSNPQNPVINWTVVLERMGGLRLRIQCRYKWNKLLKREATLRALQMEADDRVWLITRLRELQFEDESQVEWDALALLHPKNFWTGLDFKVCFEKMRASVKDYKTKKMDEVCSILFNSLYGQRGLNNVFDQMNLDKEKEEKKKDVDLASAAVAAVTGDNTYFL